MSKVDVVHVLKSKNSVIEMRDLRSDIEKKFNTKISRVDFSKETELKVFFDSPVSLNTVDRFIELRVNIKEMNWKYQKHIGKGTAILEVLIE